MRGARSPARPIRKGDEEAAEVALQGPEPGDGGDVGQRSSHDRSNVRVGGWNPGQGIDGTGSGLRRAAKIGQIWQIELHYIRCP